MKQGFRLAGRGPASPSSHATYTYNISDAGIRVLFLDPFVVSIGIVDEGRLVALRGQNTEIHLIFCLLSRLAVSLLHE